MILGEQRETMQEKLNGEFTKKQNELKSKIDQTAASVEEIKNTPKVAFRATCVHGSHTTYSVDYPGKNFCKTSSQDKVNLIKTKNTFQFYGKISSTISVLHLMDQNSLVRMMEFILFMQLHRYLVNTKARLKFMSMER